MVIFKHIEQLLSYFTTQIIIYVVGFVLYKLNSLKCKTCKLKLVALKKKVFLNSNNIKE